MTQEDSINIELIKDIRALEIECYDLQDHNYQDETTEEKVSAVSVWIDALNDLGYYDLGWSIDGW